MIDETFLRQTAALQANLKMLESQQDALSDFQDMQALRLYKARLLDYIEAHSKAGNLSPDPFQVIKQRLIAVSNFFTAADQEYQRITRWKKNWLKGIPNISLSDIQSARAELSDLVAEVPHAQQRLRQMLSALDWDTSSSSVDLHPELLACAQCVDALKLPNKEEIRTDLYQFAQGEGKLTKGVSTHHTVMGLRIEELNQLHEVHAQAIADIMTHLTNEDFKTAQNIFEQIGLARFMDIEYSQVESGIKEQFALFHRLSEIQASLSGLLSTFEIQAVGSELEKIGEVIHNNDSALGRRFLSVQKASKLKSPLVLANWPSGSLRHVVVSFFAIFSSLARRDLARERELEAFEIQQAAEAEREAAEAKIRAEAAWAKSSGKRAGEEKVIEVSPGVKMIFCWCPAGKFTMGSPKSEVDRSDDERQVEVTLSQGFWMAKTEVTQAQWQAVLGDNPSEFKGANRPVESVSWDEAQEFLTKVNLIIGNSDGGQMALPTEAQWEYAARAGDAGMYSGGILDEVAWYWDNNGDETHPVGTKKPNAWGLHDMLGNVCEWCADWYEKELEGGVDPQGAVSGAYRVLRGGRWDLKAIYCRVASRNFYSQSYIGSRIGFRVARSSVP
jgi:formylglycine-generating enzyme required for sulfatase activity